MQLTEFLLLTILTWFVAAGVCCGIGSLMLRLVTRDTRIGGAGERFWLGIAGIIALALIWNFFWPLDATATCILIAMGGIGWIVEWITQRCAWLTLKKQPSEWICFCLFAIAIAWASAGECVHYDTGLYGEATVQWALHYPAVPGIANLYGRLGFNSSNFLCLAMLDHGIWRERSQHLFASLLIVGLGAWAVPAFVRVFWRPDRATASDWFQAILLLPLIPFLSMPLGCMDSDIPSMVFALAAAATLIRSADRELRPLDADPVQLGISIVLLSALVTLKLSAVVFATVLSGFILVAIIRSTASKSAKTRVLLGTTGIVGVIALAWMVRGAILSGYPLYPGTFLKAPVEWRATRSAIDDALWIRSWARTPWVQPSQAMGFHWIRGWVKRTAHDGQYFQLPAGIFLTTLATWSWAAIRKKYTIFVSADLRPLCFAFIASGAAGLIFWLIAAPDPRFAGFDIWIIVATSSMLALFSLGKLGVRLPRGLLLIFLLLELLACHRGYIRFHFIHPDAPVRTGSVQDFVCRSGLVVKVPVNIDQLWLSPLPGTPYPNPLLRLRVQGDLSKGFVCDTQ